MDHAPRTFSFFLGGTPRAALVSVVMPALLTRRFAILVAAICLLCHPATAKAQVSADAAAAIFAEVCAENFPDRARISEAVRKLNPTKFEEAPAILYAILGADPRGDRLASGDDSIKGYVDCMFTAAKGRVADIANAIERKLALKRDPAAEENFVFSTKAVRTMGGRQVPDDFPVPDHRSYEFKQHYIEITQSNTNDGIPTDGYAIVIVDKRYRGK
jgi:hypothetical protein